MPTPATRSSTVGPSAVPSRPPFAFAATAPPGYEALRGDTPSLRDDLFALVARTPVWTELDERRRRGLASILEAVAQASATARAVATLLRLGDPHAATDLPPDVSALTLSWLRTAPAVADLDLARLVLRGGEPVETGLGPGVVARRVEHLPGGGALRTAQVAAPLSGSIWLAVVTGTSTRAHDTATDDALIALAASLRVDRSQA